MKLLSKILVPLTGLLLLAGYAFAGNSSISTLIPSPSFKAIKGELGTIQLTPQTTIPSPCPAGTLYYNQVLDGLYLCNAVDASNDINAWLRIDGTPGGTVFLKNGNDKIVNSGTYTGLSKGLNINGGSLVIADSTDPATDVVLMGRGHVGLIWNPSENSLRVGRNVMIGSLGAYNPESYIFGGDHVVEPTASIVSILGGTNHSITGTITHAVIGGGDRNGVAADFGTVAGGSFNTVSAINGFVGGGTINSILAAGNNSSIVGGRENTIANGAYGFIGGGSLNSISGDHAVLVGGGSNQAIGNFSVVSGGTSNTARGNNSIIPGGAGNETDESGFSLGWNNMITGNTSGGVGEGNVVSGDNSYAIGSGLNVANDNMIALSDPVAITRSTVRGGGITVNLDVGDGEIIADDHYVPTTGTFSELIRFRTNACDSVFQASHAGITVGDMDANGTCDVTFPMSFDGAGLHTPTCNVMDPTVSKHGYVVITDISVNGFSYVVIDGDGGQKLTDVVCTDIGQKSKVLPLPII